MSDRVPPERAAFDELQALVTLLADELAGFRQRALAAEQRVKQVTREAGQPALAAGASAQERVIALEAEHVALRSRLSQASDRTRAMLDRVRFLRQQSAGAEAVGAEDDA